MANSRGSRTIVGTTFLVLGLACLFTIDVVEARGRGRGRVGEAVFDIRKFGAKSDNGRTSNEYAIIRAWRAACDSVGPARLLIPYGNFVAGEIVFRGPCAGQKLITIDIQGNLLAVDDPTNYPGKAWINVENVNNIVVTGGGTINARGAPTWEYANDGVPLPASIQFQTVGFGKMYNLKFIDSMGVHSKVTDSHDIAFWNLKITASGTSPNTDGIHTSNTTNIRITDSNIGTGDDCISIGHGSNNVLIARVTCGPGHGISVGSLGKRPNELSLKGVTVINCTMKGTTNGARIKTYHASPQIQATGIIFQDIVMDRVQNPIIIDQHYQSKNKPQQSRVKLSDVHFRNIRGTTVSAVAVGLYCSSTFPCQGVELADINLVPFGRIGRPLTSVCSNARAYVRGKFSLPTPLKCIY